MENDNASFSPSESLQLIDSMIRSVKGRISENGHMYLLWGWVIFFCSVTQYLLRSVWKLEEYYLVWLLTWVALAYQIFYIRKERKKRRVRTYSEEIIAAVWISFGISMLIIGIILGTHSFREQRSYDIIMNPILLGLYGVPTFVSGTILRFPALRRGGIACWILALLSIYVPEQYQILLLALAVAVAWIVPGYQLRKIYYSNLHHGD